MSKLFLMGAFGLMSLTVSAADLIERTAPTPEDAGSTAVAFEVGKTYILYNVDAQMYFTQGSNWSTRGCVVPNKVSAVPVRVAKYTLADASWDGQTYEIQNYVTNRSSYSWYKMCMNTEGQLYLDQTSWARFVELKAQGNNVYRIMPSEANKNVSGYETVYSDGTQFVGYAGLQYDGGNDTAGFEDASERLPLSALTTEAVDWVFYDYSAFDAYEKSGELKKLIEDAEKAGVDVSAAVEVYNNEAATVAQMQAAMDALSDAIANNTFAGFTPGKALDVTSLIVNHNFTGGDVSGWDGTTWGHGNSQDNVEHYNKTYDTFQTIAGLRAGLYVVGMNGFYRAGSAQDSYDKGKADDPDVRNATFYVTSGETTLAEAPVSQIYSGRQTESKVSGESEVSDGETKYYWPNNSTSANYYFHTLGLYKNSLFATMPAAGSMTIGVKKEASIGGDWSIYDDFSLIYCGEGATAYQAYVEYYRDNMFPDYESQRVEAADPFVTTDGINCTDSYISAFKATNVNATDEASARAAMAALEEAFEPLRENVALWAEYLALAKKASNEVANNESLNHQNPIVEEVDDWTILAAEDWNAHEMSNEELRAFIDEMTEKIKEAKKQVVVDTGETYATDLLVNPDFENGTTGWTIERVAGGNVVHGGNNDNHCFEGWNNANYDIYQVVKDAPEGVYRIEVQGFYRYGRGRYSDYHEQNNQYVKPGGSPVFVYMNHKKTPFTNIYGDPKQITEASFYEGTGYEDVPVDADGNQVEAGAAEQHLYYPNDMASAAKAFSAQMYKQSAYGIIRAGQEMRIGVKGNSTQLNDSWCIWDNFQLFNCGKDATALNNVLPEEIENAQKLLLDDNGQPKLMGKEIKEGLEKAIADAQAALGTTGEAMFDALNDLFDAEENVDESVALFAQLATANDKLFATAEQNSDNPVAEEAFALYEEILGALGGYEYSDSDVADKLAEINKMLTKFRLPSEEEYKDASPMNPVDFTQVIENPGYETEEGTPLADGWSGTGVGTNDTGLNAEIFNNTFDHYQEFYGLPAGQYEVSVLGFYRYGGHGPTNDYAAWTEDPTVNNNALLYANNQSVALKRLAEFADGEHAGEDDWAEVEAESGLYVPNMMATAGTLFMEKGDALRNKVTAIVGADGYLRIGLKKDVAVANDWTIFDSWQLWYLGASLPGDVNGDGAVDVADISAIISDMAAGTNAPSADVNGDGAVDVADISAVITIMAENARLAKAIEE